MEQGLWGSRDFEAIGSLIPRGNLCRRGLNPPGTFIPQGLLCRKGLNPPGTSIPQGLLCRRGLTPLETYIPQGVLCRRGFYAARDSYGNGPLSTKLQLHTGGKYYNEKYYSFLDLLLRSSTVNADAQSSSRRDSSDLRTLTWGPNGSAN